MSPAIGDTAPGFRLPTTDGGEVALDEFAGGPATVVAFWCNHCPYVRAWEERFDDIARVYSDRGVATVAICANDPVSHPGDSFEAMVARAAERRYGFAYAQDLTQEVARAYGAERTPEVFVIDGDGRVAYHGAIDDASDPDAVRTPYLRDALDAVLGGRTPATAETPAVGCTIKWSRAGTGG
ncbi:thioredoxin family protein [Miltoncostaea oceani]|uniref:thioredoxin family protein n=1 Tax=Miltoncostaea oceani TaxID=2843216 RepID=UPI001C3C88D1|nr:thioredoxin family protein [Miltoncostaea oceani]